MDLGVFLFIVVSYFFSLSPEHLGILVGTLALLVVFLWSQLRVKRFYFVRHGETLLNEAGIKQGADGKLSAKGVAQARATGTAFRKRHIEAIYSSPYERAVETAKLIQQELKGTVAVTATPLLSERRNPSAVVGRRVDDPEVKEMMGRTAYAYHEDSYRFSDEENFEDLRARAKKCLRYLELAPSRQTIVVTHHAFLQMILSYMLYRNELHASSYAKLAYFNPAENAGVSVCDYHPWHGRFSKTNGWEVISYNQPTILQ
ncbi:MAG: histidine phosphatase family protein [Candidatus Pacebacteria bacterium]|nr:histidine phosphatase family protein [Candidatus Paceibacterota bacterium]